MGAPHVSVRTEAGVFVIHSVRVLKLHRTRVAIDRLRKKAALLRRGQKDVRAHGRTDIPVAFGGGKAREKIAHASADDVERRRAVFGKTGKFFRDDLLHRQNSLKFFPFTVYQITK